MDERAFWVIVRRALLMVVAAIEARWGLSKDRPDVAELFASMMKPGDGRPSVR